MLSMSCCRSPGVVVGHGGYLLLSTLYILSLPTAGVGSSGDVSRAHTSSTIHAKDCPHRLLDSPDVPFLHQYPSRLARAVEVRRLTGSTPTRGSRAGPAGALWSIHWLTAPSGRLEKRRPCESCVPWAVVTVFLRTTPSPAPARNRSRQCGMGFCARRGCEGAVAGGGVERRVRSSGARGRGPAAGSGLGPSG